MLKDGATVSSDSTISAKAQRIAGLFSAKWHELVVKMKPILDERRDHDRA
jgi:hypothetical protein